MISTFALARRKSGTLFSQFALAVALAGGAVVGSAAIAPAAYAQNSDGFAKVYQPVATIINGEAPDFAAAAAKFEAVAAAIETEDDRNVAGNLALLIGNGLSDPTFQRRGLELMLASGKVAPEQVGQFQFFVGNLAYNAQDYAASRTALMAAMAAGYTDNDPAGLVIETFLQEDKDAEGIAYALNEASKLEAAGQPVPEQWLLRTLGTAFNADMADESIALSKILVRNHPTESNWINALQIVGALRAMEPQVELDLLRLMRETDALSRRGEYVRYIEAADPRIMANEVLPVLAAGLAADVFQADGDYYIEVKGIADSRAAADRSNPDATVTEGLAGDARDAQISGDVLWSIGDFARAAELYQASIDKGGDVNLGLTRKGMAQAKAGDYAGAIATLAQVTGERAPVAEMWTVYAQTKLN